MNVTGWATWAIRHPAWVAYLARHAALASLRSRPDTSPGVAALPTRPLDLALADVLRRPLAEVRRALAEYEDAPIERRSGPLPDRWAASHTLAAACYAGCRVLRPALVVEAGSGAGFSAAAILKALHVNGHGRLISVELPRLGTKDFSYVGSAIPDALRDRWEVHLGPSLPVLRTVLARDASIDVFLHDSDHSYWNQAHEFAFALSRFGESGLLIADDVRNSSFTEAACRHGVNAELVAQPPKGWPFGLLSPAARAQLHERGR